MGIYDREYIRREGPSFLGSFSERGYVCKWLVGINVAAFVLQMLTRNPLTHQEPFTDAFLLDVNKVMHGEVWRLITGAFLHSTESPLHILFNMLFLWWFGSDVEDIYGHKEFLALYLGGALVGNIAFVLSHLFLYNGHGLALGASGAVTTVLVVCACHYPTRVILLFFVLPVPIWLFVVGMVAMDAFNFLGRTSTGVAVEAHLAGALFGFLYYRFHWRLTTWWPSFKNWKRRRAQPKLRVYREEEKQPAPAAVTSTAAAQEEEQLEAKMDAVLEKIHREGKENLTQSEREVLLRASEIYKRRRR